MYDWNPCTKFSEGQNCKDMLVSSHGAQGPVTRILEFCFSLSDVDPYTFSPTLRDCLFPEGQVNNMLIFLLVRIPNRNKDLK